MNAQATTTKGNTSNIGQSIIDVAMMLSIVSIVALFLAHFAGFSVLVPAIVTASAVLLGIIIGSALIYLSTEN